MKFKVNVEKKMYATGVVEVDCNTCEQAVKLVQNQIDKGLSIEDVEWDDAQYEDWSFTTTGDVDESSEGE